MDCKVSSLILNNIAEILNSAYEGKELKSSGNNLNRLTIFDPGQYDATAGGNRVFITGTFAVLSKVSENRYGRQKSVSWNLLR